MRIAVRMARSGARRRDGRRDSLLQITSGEINLYGLELQGPERLQLLVIDNLEAADGKRVAQPASLQMDIHANSQLSDINSNETIHFERYTQDKTLFRSSMTAQP